MDTWTTLGESSGIATSIVVGLHGSRGIMKRKKDEEDVRYYRNYLTENLTANDIQTMSSKRTIYRLYSNVYNCSHWRIQTVIVCGGLYVQDDYIKISDQELYLRHLANKPSGVFPRIVSVLSWKEVSEYRFILCHWKWYQWVRRIQVLAIIGLYTNFSVL